MGEALVDVQVAAGACVAGRAVALEAAQGVHADAVVADAVGYLAFVYVGGARVA